MWSLTAIPTSSPEEWVPSDHGGAGIRVLCQPFKGLPGSNAGLTPLDNSLQLSGGRGCKTLYENHGG